MLLVLDHCEHVIEAAAALAVDTLRGRRACDQPRAVTHRGRTRAPSVTAGEPSHSEAEALNFPADCSWNDEFELTDADAAIVAEM